MELNKQLLLKMASILPQNFKFFKQQVKIYITAVEADGKPKGVEIPRLLDSIGTDALKMYTTLATGINADTDVPGILGRLEKYCSPRTNEITTHFELFTVKQNDGLFDVCSTRVIRN